MNCINGVTRDYTERLWELVSKDKLPKLNDFTSVFGVQCLP